MAPSSLPIQSMTGFALRQRQSGPYRLVWRLKSVNQRFLELSLKLPEGCAELELPAAKRLKTAFARGHLDCTLTVRVDGEPEGAMVLNDALLRALNGLEQEILQRLPKGIKRKGLRMGDLMRWPGMARERNLAGEDEGERAQLFALILELLNETIDELIRSRAKEGEELITTMNALLDEVDRLVDQLRRRQPQLLLDVRGRLRERLKELEQMPVEEGRLGQEIAFYLTRMDIAEELDRLALHAKEARSAIAQGGPLGRRLDFLCQELNREANTVCSKSQDGEISRLGVDLKVTLEKLREQAQNLE